MAAMTEDGSTDLVWKWTNDTLDTTTFSTGANGHCHHQPV